MKKVAGIQDDELARRACRRRRGSEYLVELERSEQLCLVLAPSPLSSAYICGTISCIVKEKPPNNPESSSSTPEDSIVAEMHSCLECLRNGDAVPKSTEELHFEIEHTQSAPIFGQYETHAIPQLTTLEHSALFAADAIAREIEMHKKEGVSEADLEEESKIEKILRGRSKAIGSGIRSYIRTILRFQQLARLRHGGRDVLKQFEETDHQRRRAHNALIESLTAFTKAIEEAKEIDLLKDIPVVEWQPGTQLPDGIENQIVVFSHRVLSDRNYIRDWAIVAELYERLKEIEQLEKKK